MSVWDRVAARYDLQLGRERAALDAAIALAEPRPEDRLLDLGTGTGGLLRRLADGPSAPREAIGIDASRTMLGQAPSLPDGWRLVQGDAARLPFPAESFDVVTAAYLLHVVAPAERAAILVEARRVLRPDGRLVCVTVSPPRPRLVGCLVSAALSDPPAGLVGLRPLDPRPDLEATGFEARRGRRARDGYPSLVVLARPRPG